MLGSRFADVVVVLAEGRSFRFVLVAREGRTQRLLMGCRCDKTYFFFGCIDEVVSGNNSYYWVVARDWIPSCYCG